MSEWSEDIAAIDTTGNHLGRAVQALRAFGRREQNRGRDDAVALPSIKRRADEALAAAREQPNCYPPNHPDCCEPGEGPNDDTYRDAAAREQPAQEEP